jgi:site-specific DNA-methyltransferase (adenine-specific)
MTAPVILGPCTLYHADCLEVLPTLTGVDAVVTDPCFGISFAAQPTAGGRKRGQKKETWDDKPSDLSVMFACFAEHPKVIWGGNYFQLPLSRGWLVWHKPDAPPSMGDVELAWTNQDRNTAMLSHSIAATNPERVGHPTQKPYRVMAWSMEQVGVMNGATICDPYMGSGTTGIACIRTGRRFIGIELDKGYFDIACDRIRRELQQTTFNL